MNPSREQNPKTFYEINPLLPCAAELENLLSLKVGRASAESLGPSLFTPLNDLLNRPGKSLRSTLVEIGFEFAGKVPSQEASRAGIQICKNILEVVHAGSIAIDDIEDGSATRRGLPSLHSVYGVPIALNAGNWLYFWPMERVSEIGLSAEQENAVFRLYHRTLLRAHMGQALDLGVGIDRYEQKAVYDLCLSALELKSGVLTALALSLGALVGEASPSMQIALAEYGHRFGVALQMFDDLGNVSGLKDPGKKWEDFRLKRPSWIWACASVSLSPGEYEQFAAATQSLPNEDLLERWFQSHPDFVPRCRAQARQFLAEAHVKLKTDLSTAELVPLQHLAALEERLVSAYE